MSMKFLLLAFAVLTRQMCCIIEQIDPHMGPESNTIKLYKYFYGSTVFLVEQNLLVYKKTNQTYKWVPLPEDDSHSFTIHMSVYRLEYQDDGTEKNKKVYVKITENISKTGKMNFFTTTPEKGFFKIEIQVTGQHNGHTEMHGDKIYGLCYLFYRGIPNEVKIYSTTDKQVVDIKKKVINLSSVVTQYTTEMHMKQQEMVEFIETIRQSSFFLHIVILTKVLFFGVISFFYLKYIDSFFSKRKQKMQIEPTVISV